jgi:hypothetical protein
MNEGLYTMLDQPWLVAAVAFALAWLVLLLVLCARIRKQSRTDSLQDSAHTNPELLLRGLSLVGFGPAVSLIHYIASQGQSAWGGVVVVLTGAALIVSHLLLKRRRRNDEELTSRATFRELSVLAQFVGLLLVLGYFGARLWGEAPSGPRMMAALIGAAAALIVISVALHIAIRIYATPEPPDERDIAFAQRGTRNAYYVLAAGTWSSLVLATAPALQAHFFYLVAGTLVAAELVRLGSQLFYYRRGA